MIGIVYDIIIIILLIIGISLAALDLNGQEKIDQFA